MVKDHVSPEERLLALIRGKHRRPEPDPEMEKADEAEAPKEPQGPHAARKPRNIKINEIFKPGFLRSKFLEPASLRVINRYIAVSAVLFAAYLFIDILFIKPENLTAVQVGDQPGYGKPAAPDRQAPYGASGSMQAPKIREYSFYSTEISQKNIFGQAEQESSQAQNIIAAEDIVGNIGLVGIIAGDNPQAVLEDKKSQKTYYMTKGESFNGFIVEDISQGRVVLDYQGKKIALSL
jgi:hypothetical protein